MAVSHLFDGKCTPRMVTIDSQTLRNKLSRGKDWEHQVLGLPKA